MLEKVINSNIRLIISICSSYIKGMNEWFWSYIVSIYLTVLFILIMVSTLIFGSSVIVDFYIEIFALFLAIHVYMSFKAVIHDYIYNRYIVRMCTNMVFLIVIAVLVEVLKN